MDISSFTENNHLNAQFTSKSLSYLVDKNCVVGIDEAGRGPVLGPMVYGGCVAPLEFEDEIRDLGLADSKTLSESDREAIFTKLDADPRLAWRVDVLSPVFISSSMLRRDKYNLNLLSHDSAIRLIQFFIDSGIRVKKVILDTVGDVTKYQSKLSSIFHDVEILVSKKADAIYPIVGAASICAKVCRDLAVKDWVCREKPSLADCEYGSGYPGDPKTKDFLRKSIDPVFGFPSIVRFSWNTADSLMRDSCVPVKWEDEEMAAVASGSKSLVNLIRPRDERRHRFFEELHLEHVSGF